MGSEMCIRDSCTEASVPENTRLESCRLVTGGMSCQLEISTRLQKQTYYEILPVPILWEGKVRQLVLDQKFPLNMHNVGTVLEANACGSHDDHGYVCPAGTVAGTDRCLEAVYAFDVPRIVSFCRFAELDSSDKPFMRQTTQGLSLIHI